MVGVFQHTTILKDAVVEWLVPKDGGSYVDATVGGGGHAEAILEACGPTGVLLGVDRDPLALAASNARLARFGERMTLLEGRYGELDALLRRAGFGRVDGLVLDAGVSSPQLDQAERGFSFSVNGPLDMRMSSHGETCAELLDRIDIPGLARILRKYGEVPRAGRLARHILEARQTGELLGTADLAALVAAKTPYAKRRTQRTHPATLVFQALRIAVNGELDDLGALCEQVPDLLNDGGRAAILSFHSLEDRIVKQTFRRHAKGPEIPAGVPLRQDEIPKGTLRVLTPRGVQPGRDEIESNPRARSARLRVVERVPRGEAG